MYWCIYILAMVHHLVKCSRQILSASVNCLRLLSSATDKASATSCPVSSHNEWDPLEEIIVGRAEGQRVPFLSPDLKVCPLSSLLFMSCLHFFYS